MEKNNVYILKNNYYNLDKKGKFIIDEIIRFCDENNKFPKEKDLTIKNGYISRTEIYRYFNTNSFAVVYDYIEKAKEEKPETMICIKCRKEKEFTDKYFQKSNQAKFGLKNKCIDCFKKESQIRYYNKKGIDISNLTIYECYELRLKGKIESMPKKFCEENAYLKIIRYIILEKNKINLDKESILKVFKRMFMEEYLIDNWVNKLGGKIECLNKCFPELSFGKEDLIKYSEYDDIKILESNFEQQGVTTLDILDGKFNIRKTRELRNLMARNSSKGIGVNEIYMMYFENKGIKHPLTKKDICIYDFKNKPNGFFDCEKNRIESIKHYCENVCLVNIMDVINDTKMLIDWAGKYFRQKDVVNIIAYSKYYSTLYQCLTEAYPCIIKNKVLFEWEWPQFNCTNKDVLVKELRDFVLHRIPDIKNIKEEAPRYINRTYISIDYPKLVKHIDRNRFNSFHEWAILSFPEYKDFWTKEMFNIIESYDGYIFDSYEEKYVYEYIKNNVFEHIVPIGRKRVGKYIFVDKNSIYSKYCPDYVVEYIEIDSKKVKLNKPIIIEYYGMYDEKCVNSKILTNYKKKTIAKEEFYRNNSDIYYIGIYPNDIKNKSEELDKLLTEFKEKLINTFKYVEENNE